MPHKDTGVAIKQDNNRALNVTQGHKRIYQTSYKSALNVTKGNKRSDQTSY